MDCPYCIGTGKVQGCQVGFSELMRVSRMNRNMTLRDVERLTDLSNAYVSQIETGKIKNPSFESVLKLCKLYQIPLETIVAFYNEENQNDHGKNTD
jgi:transcriptional regulator with XRE-family HTH domain